MPPVNDILWCKVEYASLQDHPSITLNDLLHGWPTNVIGNVNNRVRGRQCVGCVMCNVWDSVLNSVGLNGDRWPGERHFRQYEMETFNMEHILPEKLIVGEVGKKLIFSSSLTFTTYFLSRFPKNTVHPVYLYWHITVIWYVTRTLSWLVGKHDAWWLVCRTSVWTLAILNWIWG